MNTAGNIEFITMSKLWASEMQRNPTYMERVNEASVTSLHAVAYRSCTLSHIVGACTPKSMELDD